MSLRTCPSCKGPVLTEATACPKCGHRFPREWSSHSSIVITGAFLLMILLVFFLKVS
jgi:RNA polymerase subunit RPABC4/transcription elongation factor Spt4